VILLIVNVMVACSQKHVTVTLLSFFCVSMIITKPNSRRIIIRMLAKPAKYEVTASTSPALVGTQGK